MAPLGRLCGVLALCGGFPLEPHEDTWIVAVGASRYFANYRHASNVHVVGRIASRLGVPQERVLMLHAERAGCDARNPLRGSMYGVAGDHRDARRNLLLDADGCYVDAYGWSGDSVTPRALLDLLAGRHEPDAPRRRRLDSGPRSNVLVYLTGHGGDQFLKFHDSAELSADDLAAAVAEMHAKRRYRRLAFVLDTCQAGSLFEKLESPNVFAIASAKLGENAYASSPDSHIGVSLADRFTEHLAYFFERELDRLPDGELFNATFGDLTRRLERAPTRSTLNVKSTASTDDWPEELLRDFWGSPASLRLSEWPPLDADEYDQDSRSRSS